MKWAPAIGFVLLLAAGCNAVVGSVGTGDESALLEGGGLAAAPVSCETLLAGNEFFVIDDGGLVVAFNPSGAPVCVDTVEAAATELRVLGLPSEADVLEREAAFVMEAPSPADGVELLPPLPIERIEPNPQPSAPTPGSNAPGIHEPNPQPSRTGQTSDIDSGADMDSGDMNSGSSGSSTPRLGDTDGHGDPNPQPSCPPPEDFWQTVLAAL